MVCVVQTSTQARFPTLSRPFLPLHPTLVQAACCCTPHLAPAPRCCLSTTPRCAVPRLAACVPAGAETGAGGRMRDTHATGTGSIMGAGTAGYCVGNLLLEGHT